MQKVDLVSFHAKLSGRFAMPYNNARRPDLRLLLFRQEPGLVLLCLDLRLDLPPVLLHPNLCLALLLVLLHPDLHPVLCLALLLVLLHPDLRLALLLLAP